MAMKEGSVSEWVKKVGDVVGKGDLIASINSEKIEMDLESPVDGTIIEIAVSEGVGVAPGTIICYIGRADERIQSKVDGVVEKVKPLKDRVKISPVAKKMAEVANVDIHTIEGTGPGGRITKEDVEKAIDGAQVVPVSIVHEEKVPTSRQVTGMRKVIAKRMQESLQNSAQLTMNMKVDVTELLSFQKQTEQSIQAQYNLKLSLNDFISRAVVLALQEHKAMNSAYLDEAIFEYDKIHLGIAVALDNGLVVPVIMDAQELSILPLAKQIKEKARLAREGRLSHEEMTGSTFTISNLGGFGIEHFTPIINPPEAGILGVGAVMDTPLFVGEEVQKRSLLPLSLTFDHRVLDGAPAATFLQSVKRYLEEPIKLLL